jgi:hypothetical protein
MPDQIVDDVFQKAHIKRMANVMCGAVPYKKEQPIWPKIQSHPYDNGQCPMNGWINTYSSTQLSNLEQKLVK